MELAAEGLTKPGRDRDHLRGPDDDGADGTAAWGDLPQIATNASIPVEPLGLALLLGALAGDGDGDGGGGGGGGGQNLVQSNWIRDKRFGMGSYVPRIASPVTGKPEAAPSTGSSSSRPRKT